VSDGSVSAGIATDLGFPSAIARHRLRGCSLVIIEANHDPVMLQKCDRPWHVKQRIASRHGHLSNSDAAMLVADIVPDGTKCVVLAHISEKMNSTGRKLMHANEPDLAVKTVKDELAARGLDHIEIMAASRVKPTPVIEVRADGVFLNDSLT
ncbi:MAG: hypothetical protein J7M12_03575, partial [Candidatus Hydrogenedentes bacterium]|nr:hypothetical protein [Candidatus Hydrogenedentota bacterium]